MRIRFEGVSVLVAMALVSAEAPGQSDGLEGPRPWAILPFANVAGTYDSNVGLASSHEEDDVFLDSRLGFRLLYEVPEIEVNGLGFVAQRSYAEAGERDFWAGGELVRLRCGSPERIEVRAYQSFRWVEDLDTYGPEVSGGLASDAFLDADVRSERMVTEAGAAIDAAISERNGLQAAYGFRGSDYRDTDLLDLRTHLARVEAAQRVTDRSSALITVLGGLQGSESVDGMAEYSAARLGVTTRGTDRVTVKAGAGVQRLERPDAGGSDEGFHYDAVASWRATDRTTLQVEGRNGVQLSSVYRANVVDFSILRLGIASQTTPSLGFSASGVYRIDDYADPVPFDGATVHRKDDGLALTVRADYLLPPSRKLRLFAEATSETVESTIRDYSVARVSVGAQLGL